MENTKLNKLREELSRARKKRDYWDVKVKDLERRYREAENTCIHDLVHAANMTPEELAELIRMASSSLPQTAVSFGAAEKMENDTCCVA